MRILCYLIVLFCTHVCFAAQICPEFKHICKPDNLHALTKPELQNMQVCLRQQEALMRVHKQTLREHIRQKRFEELEKKRSLRLQGKCETVRRQIEQLNKRYKQGYTIAQGNVLDRKLAELKLRKQKYCG